MTRSSPFLMRQFANLLLLILLGLASVTILHAQAPRRGQWLFLGSLHMHTQLRNADYSSDFRFIPGPSISAAAAYRWRILGPLALQPTLTANLVTYRAYNNYRNGPTSDTWSRAFYHDLVGHLGLLLRLDLFQEKFMFTLGPELVAPFGLPGWFEYGYAIESGSAWTNFRAYKPQGAAQTSIGMKLPINSPHTWTLEAFGRLYQLDRSTFDYPLKHIDAGLRLGWFPAARKVD